MSDSARELKDWPAMRGVTAALEAEVAALRRQLAIVSSEAPKGVAPRPFAPDELEFSEARYRALLELTPQVVCITDAQGSAIYKNRYWYDFSGMTMEQSLGTGWLSAIHPDDMENMGSTWVAAVTAGVPYESEFRFRRADGEYRWHLARAIPLKDSTGKIVNWLAISVDIHDRKTAAAAVAEAEERMRVVMESAGLGACDYFPMRDKMEFTPRTYEVLHLSPETEASLETMLACAHPDDRAHIQAVLGGLLQSGVTGDYEIEHRIVWPDGNIRWVLCRGRCIFPASGEPRLSGAVLDITERKHAELERTALTAAIAEAEERLRFVADAAGLGGCDYYPLKDKVVWSGKSYELLGLPPDAKPSVQAYVDQIHPEDRPHVEQEMHRLIEQGANSEYEVDYRVISPDGKERWLLSKGKCFVPGAGEPESNLRLTGIMLDITERKRAERELATLNTAIQHSPDFIGIADSQGNNLFLNQAGQKLVGLRDDAEARSKTVDDFLLPEELKILDQQILPAIRAGRVWEGEFRLRHFVTGEPVLVDTRAFGIFDATGRLTGLATVSRDVSERKKLQEQLQLAQKMEAVGQLAGGIAHDFNNLMTIIRGASEVLERRQNHDPVNAKTIQEIREAAERTSTLTEQLLAFGRRQMIRPRALNLNQVILGTQDMLRRLLGEDVEVITDLPGDLWNVKMDPVQIDQILLNLAANARDAMPHGGKISIRTFNRELLEPPAEQPSLVPGQYVGLEFADTGSGMDVDTLRRAFEPFFTTKEHGKGTGMGLATVYGVVKQSSGYISVKSKPRAGTVFDIFLPRTLEEIPVEDERQPQESVLGHEKIMLVEDESSLRDLISEYLREHGYTVHEAPDARNAMELARVHAIDLLITDIVMPGESGHHLASSLLELQPDVAVIFVSGFAEHAALEDALKRPNVVFLQKPFRFSELVLKIRHVLGVHANQKPVPSMPVP